MQFKNIEFTETQLESLLSELGFKNISNHGSEYRMSWADGSNPNGTVLFKDNLKFIHWSTGDKGDIIDMISKKLSLSIKESFKILERFLKSKIVSIKKDDNIAMLLLDLSYSHNKDEYPVYPESCLDIYVNCVSKLFLEDGIGLLSQAFFDIKYCIEDERVVFPARDDMGRIVGVLGRFNCKECPKNIAKYLPLIPYKKHRFLFGLYENREFLQGTVIIVESEKSVMKAFSMGYRNVIALGGMMLSQEQLDLIDSLNPSEVILALDEGVDEEHIKKTAKQLISANPFVSRHVGYIPSNDVGLGNKNCIFDEEENLCKHILEEEVKWIA